MVEDYSFMIWETPLTEYPHINIHCQDINKLHWLYHATHIKHAKSILDNGLHPTFNTDGFTTEIEGNYFYTTEPSIDQYQLGCSKGKRSDPEDFSVVLRVNASALDNTAFLIDVTDEHSRALWKVCGGDFDQYVLNFGAIIYTKQINSNLLQLVGCHNCKHGLLTEHNLSIEQCPQSIRILFEIQNTSIMPNEF
jgi:hypothetical protein